MRTSTAAFGDGIHDGEFFYGFSHGVMMTIAGSIGDHMVNVDYYKLLD